MQRRDFSKRIKHWRIASAILALTSAFRMVRRHPPMSASDAPAAPALVRFAISSIDLVGAAAVHVDVDRWEL